MKVNTTILLIEDNPVDALLIKEILAEVKLKCELIITERLSDGLDWLAQTEGTIDAILLDLNLADSQGIETFIRLQEKVPHLPIVIMTNIDDETVGMDAVKKGAQDYLIKGQVTGSLLARSIRYSVERKLSEHKLAESLELNLKMTSELQRAYDELNNIDTMKTDFLSYISQEIRIPLNGITGTINLIKNQQHSSTIKDLVETLDVSVSRLEDFTYKALYFSQLSQPNFRIQETKIKLKDLLQYVILELDDLIRSKEIEVVTTPLINNFFLNADRDLLFKAFVYLLDNALTFSPPKSKIMIDVSIGETDVTCSFTDEGTGFSEEVLRHFLLPFGLPNINGSQKTGLSLYIVRQIMAVHKGKIRLSNKENDGACVELIFNK
jgi:signal transduction histidine kinase